MKNQEIKSLSNDELVERVKVAKQNLDSLNFEHGISPLKNPREITSAKRLVARLKTEVGARNIKVVQEAEINAENIREWQASEDNGLLEPMKLKKVKRFAGVAKGTRI